MKLLRVKDLKEHGTGLAISTTWRDIKRGTFPPPFKLSTRMTVFSSDDIDEWIQFQLSKDSIRYEDGKKIITHADGTVEIIEADVS